MHRTSDLLHGRPGLRLEFRGRLECGSLRDAVHLRRLVRATLRPSAVPPLLVHQTRQAVRPVRLARRRGLQFVGGGHIERGVCVLCLYHRRLDLLGGWTVRNCVRVPRRVSKLFLHDEHRCEQYE